MTGLSPAKHRLEQDNAYPDTQKIWSNIRIDRTLQTR